jgi:hypothetical protein
VAQRWMLVEIAEKYLGENAITIIGLPFTMGFRLEKCRYNNR